MSLHSSFGFDVSIIVVSFNTRDLLHECLDSALAECARLPDDLRAEILVVDNASGDDSAEMVAAEFAASSAPVRLFRSEVNLGFGAANNLAIREAQGRYLVLLNSDAFFRPGALALAIEHMDADTSAGIGGARLVSRDGGWQPSARIFPSIWLDARVLMGHTWPDPSEAAEVDWVPGAFTILRREALDRAGLFDPRFFFYFEEVDLCRRVKAAGFHVLYWPDIVITHLGGESGRQSSQRSSSVVFSETGALIILWRMRSALLYYRKHHGRQAVLARILEEGIYGLRRLRNRLSLTSARRLRAREFAQLASLMRQAWADTKGGRVSPRPPW
jgi:GT2 family glycosyltransferase